MWSRNSDRATPTNDHHWVTVIRPQQMRDEPLCRHCAQRGIVTAGQCVDHIDNDSGNNDPSNLQTLCNECHGRKTVIDSGFKPRLRGWI